LTEDGLERFFIYGFLAGASFVTLISIGVYSSLLDSVRQKYEWIIRMSGNRPADCRYCRVRSQFDEESG